MVKREYMTRMRMRTKCAQSALAVVVVAVVAAAFSATECIEPSRRHLPQVAVKSSAGTRSTGTVVALKVTNRLTNTHKLLPLPLLLANVTIKLARHCRKAHTLKQRQHQNVPATI